jgi:hypothetical protein
MTCGDFPEHGSRAPQGPVFDLEKRGRRSTNRGIDAEGFQNQAAAREKERLRLFATFECLPLLAGVFEAIATKFREATG